MTDIATAKSTLRKEMLAKREALSPTQKLEATQSVKLHFTDHPHLAFANSFAGYYAIRGEIDVLPIFNHMLRFNKQMALPRIHDTELRFHAWQPGQKLEDGAHAIKAPPAENETIIPDVVLVPLLAFDDRGYRLGYGGGYYDRVIADYRAHEHPTLFIGVAYDIQETPALPVEDHDQRLNGILTQQGVSLFD